MKQPKPKRKFHPSSFGYRMEIPQEIIEAIRNSENNEKRNLDSKKHQ